MTLVGLRVVVGVGGGIAAYKTASLVRLLTEDGADVTVIPTRSALRFVGAATWEALSGNPVSTEVWDRVADVQHVALGQAADVVIVAPATADLLGRAVAGLADDLLTTTLLATRAPVVMAPAMHTEMWLHPATVANVAVLRQRGVTVLDPGVGRLTGRDSGPGRLPEPDELFEAVVAAIRPRNDLSGRKVLVSAGGTREPLDPVRFLGNRSSGRQGHAIAAVAAARGAHVTLVSAGGGLDDPPGVDVVRVETTEQMREAMLSRQRGADAVVMCAAVADFRPTTVSPVKLKKGADSEPTSLELERTPDILRELVAARPDGQIVVGFAAETGDGNGTVLDHATRKLRNKGCDLLVVNDVSGGAVFGESDNEVVILSATAPPEKVERADKSVVATAVWDAVARTSGWDTRA